MPTKCFALLSPKCYVFRLDGSVIRISLKTASRCVILQLDMSLNPPFSPVPCSCSRVHQVADLVSGETTALIALESGRVVGTIDCAVQPSTADIGQGLEARSGVKTQALRRDSSPERSQVFLKNLFVLPEQRRRGIARKLVEGAEDFARKERAGVLCLQVDRKNKAARELYYSCGFEDVEPPGPVEGGFGGALLRALGMGKNFMVKEA